MEDAQPLGGIAAPEALDERGGGGDLPIEVLLPLLLLDFERESGAQDPLPIRDPSTVSLIQNSQL